MNTTPLNSWEIYNIRQFDMPLNLFDTSIPESLPHLEEVNCPTSNVPLNVNIDGAELF